MMGALVLGRAGSASAQVVVRELQPDTRWSGRARAVTVHPTNPAAAIVATESGGLFRTWDGGDTWFHADGLAMFRMTDVQYAPQSPAGTQVVLATGWRDSRVGNGGGIWRSADAGATWTRPVTADPPGAPGCLTGATAWSIAFEPGTSNVYVGTDCGLAVSRDLGATFTHVVPDAAQPPVLSVAAHAGGIVDVCRRNGHHRSNDSGRTFGAASPGFGGCEGGPRAIAASPLERGVVFAVTDQVSSPTCSWRPAALLQGTPNADGSVAWRQASPVRCRNGLGRSPWLEVHASRDGNPRNADLYFGDGLNVLRRSCAAGSLCPTTGWSPVAVDHPDAGGMAYDRVGNCPRYLVSDGGVHRPTDAGDPAACGGSWSVRPSGAGGANALQIYEVTGQLDADRTDLYLGTQDNQFWASSDGGLRWPFVTGNEGSAIHTARHARSRDSDRVVYTDAMAGSLESQRLFAGERAWRRPAGGVGGPALVAPGVHVQFAQPMPMMNRFRLMLTTDAGANWTDTGAELTAVPWGQVKVAVSGRDVVLYQAVQMPIVLDVDNQLALVRITGIRTDGTLDTVMAGPVTGTRLRSVGVFPHGEGTFVWPAVFAVDPNDPSHLIAADAGDSTMKVSRNGGDDWTQDLPLTDLVTGLDPATGRREFRFYIPPSEDMVRVPGSPLQVHEIAFDPFHRNRILVGTEAAGIFRSDDDGRTWAPVPGSRQVTGISTFFFRENTSTDPIDTVYVSTYGRGLWTLRLPLNSNRPFFLPEHVADVWSREWIRDRYTGSIIDWELFIDPDYCPPCRWVAVLGGRLLGGRVGQDGLEALVTDSPDARLVASSVDGMPLALAIGLEHGQPPNLDLCPGCGPLLKDGGAIRGVALLDGEVKAGIAGKGPLPGEAYVAQFEPGSGLPQPAAPMGEQGRYLHFVGADGIGPFAAGESVTVHGTGFCGAPQGCSEVTLKVGERVVAQNVAVDTKGGFSALIVPGTTHGLYTVAATQVDGKGKPMGARQPLILAVRDEEGFE